ncbi:ATPase, F0 complex, subunit B/B', bacterial and chloroplast [Candidatus Magnetobacterium bavaricum]|uniref:ATP synthase subunit b n=1 Tax=Candidatus Magnetobacterium bavaricum TaxID=29290 RepID=A0A0F3GQJ4_9BACT|nr:ATPase, F0 complex, subunit B/B', bacterial and chloroplast [Candidatus Magnetobacterium bavaricum]
MVEFSGWFFVLLANFLVLLVVLDELLYKPVINMLIERDRVKLNSLREAMDLLAKKDAAFESLKRDLADAHEQAKKEYMKLKEEGVLKRKEIVEKAQEEAIKKFSGAVKEIASEVDKVRSSLKTEIDSYADAIIERLVYERKN